jgi:NDP-sugar pyrophosphorylase family protein
MNYLYGWNPVAEFILDEFMERGSPVHGVVIDDEYLYSSPHPKHLAVFTASGIMFEQNDVVINCLGYKNLIQRIGVGERLLKMGVLKSFVSRKAQAHPSVAIGVGTVLVGDVVIERGCEIGKHGLFWGGSRICHDSTLGSGVFLASGSIVGGGCTVGSACSLGFNSAMKEKSSMPDGTKVGANHFWKPES